MCASCVWAEDDGISHEIAGDVSWISYDWLSSHYENAGETFPQRQNRLRADYQQIHGAYSFFFTPIPEDEHLPFILRRFYAHPTTLRFRFAVEPEHEETYTDSDPDRNFQAVTHEQHHSRSAGADLELYIFSNTALLFSVHSAKTEQETHSSSSLSTTGRGENDEIQRSYGFGISRYLSEHFRTSIHYAFTDGEYFGITSSWNKHTPLSISETIRDSDSNGGELTIDGTYIIRQRWGIRGSYHHTHSTEESTIHYLTSESLLGYQNLTSRLLRDNDSRKHELEMSVDFYWKPNVTLCLGWALADYALETRYGTSQAVDYDWGRWTVRSGLIYTIHRHLGLQLDYTFAQQDGSVETWFPDSQSEQRSTFEVEADWQIFRLGISGRF